MRAERKALVSVALLDSTLASSTETRRVLSRVSWWDDLWESRLAVLRGRMWVKQMVVTQVVEKDATWGNSLEWTMVRR